MKEPDYIGFAKAIMRDWPDVGGLDGFDMQELGEEYGILVPEERTKLCDPDCNCAEYYSSEEVASGFTCYRAVWATAPDREGQAS